MEEETDEDEDVEEAHHVSLQFPSIRFKTDELFLSKLIIRHTRRSPTPTLLSSLPS